MKSLLQLQAFGVKILEKYPKINEGGCAVFAALMANELVKFYPVTVLVSDTYGGVDNIDEVRSAVSCNTVYEWNDNGLYFGHVFLEITHDNKKYHFDAGNLCSADERDPSLGFPIIPGCLTLKEVNELADCDMGWNSSFNRDNIPQLKLKVKTFFAKEFRV